MNLLSSIDATDLPVTELDSDELWYKDAIIYQLHVKAFVDSNNDGIGDFAGLTRQARLSAGSRRHRALAVAVLSLARPRRRLRHRRLRRDQSRFRDDEGFPPLHRGGQAARPARHHRARDQSHLRPASTGSSAPAAATRGRARATGMSGATPTRNIRARASSSPTPRNRTGPGIRRPAPYLLAPLLLAPAGSEFRQSARGQRDRPGHEALARCRRRRLPARRDSLSVRARRHQQREPAGDPRDHQEAARRARRLRQGQGAARRGQSVAGGRAANISATATNATWPITSR